MATWPLRHRNSLLCCVAAILALLIPAGASGSVATGGGTLRCVAGSGCWGILAEIDPEGAFVAGSIRDLLGRQASAGDLSFWQSALTGGATHGQMAGSIATGSEYRANLVTGLYGKFLRRSPNSNELNAEIQALGSSTDEKVIASLVGSPEYFSLAEDNVTKFISSVYLDLLGRGPTAGDQSYWMGALGSTTHTKMAEEIATSSEYRTSLIHGFYAKFLHRSPSPAELNTWTQALGGGGTDEEVITGLVGSAEYSSRNPGWAASVDWGDGTASGGAVAGEEVSGSHIYRAFGSFPIVVTLSDDRGVSATVGATAEVEPEPNGFSLGAVRRVKSRGTAILSVTVPGPGALRLSGKGIVTRTMTAAAAGTVGLLVKGKGKTRRRLDRNGDARVKVTVSYTPTYGLPNQMIRAMGLRKNARER